MRHDFVEFVPRELSEGVLYVSVRFKTVVHLCACGCGTKIATPISPANWKLGWDGDAITLSPSIGAWGLPCRSHYWIKSNQVQWSTQWTDDQIRRGRVRDDRERREHFAQSESRSATAPGQPAVTPRLWGQLINKVLRRG
jgi:hypothetical protein